MNFLLLCIQSAVCSACVYAVKRAGIISFRDFDLKDAKMWFPISFMLVLVIYTGSKSLQYLSIPVYTIFKNLTIILIVSTTTPSYESPAVSSATCRLMVRYFGLEGVLQDLHSCPSF